MSIYFDNSINEMVQIDGIEPTTPAWKAGVLPLNYIRNILPRRAVSFYCISDKSEKINGNVITHNACDIIAHCAPTVPSIPLASAKTTVFIPIGNAQ